MSRLVAFQTDPKTFEQNTAQCNVTVLQSNALVTSHQGAANSKQINLNSTHFKSSSSLQLIPSFFTLVALPTKYSKEVEYPYVMGH